MAHFFIESENGDRLENGGMVNFFVAIYVDEEFTGKVIILLSWLRISLGLRFYIIQGWKTVRYWILEVFRKSYCHYLVIKNTA